MYKIGICDDSKLTCTELENMLRDIMQSLRIEAEIEPWYSGESLCKYLEAGNRFDLIFLDIELLKLSGIDVGNYIRNYLDDLKTSLPYISYNRSYAMRLFKIQPLDFLVKPLQYNSVRESVEMFLKRAGRKKTFLEYRTGNNYCREMCEDIIYLTSDNKKIHLITIANKEIEFYGKLKALKSQLPSNFIQIHQSYIINEDYMVEINYEQVQMSNGAILNISKPYRVEVRNRLLRK